MTRIGCSPSSFRDHFRGEWIEAEWSLAKQSLAPFSLDVLRAARKAVQERDQNPSGVDILGEISRIQTGGARTVKEQRAAKRDSVNKPVVPPLSSRVEQADADATEASLASVSPRSTRPASTHRAAWSGNLRIRRTWEVNCCTPDRASV